VESRTCHTCGTLGHISRACPQKAADGTVCAHCKKTGHVKAKCYKLKTELAVVAAATAAESGSSSTTAPTSGRRQQKKQTELLRDEVATLRSDGLQRAARSHATQQRTLLALEAHVSQAPSSSGSPASLQALLHTLRDEVRQDGLALAADTALDDAPVLRSPAPAAAGGRSHVAVQGGSQRWSFSLPPLL
jgi:hypothetical protein